MSTSDQFTVTFTRGVIGIIILTFALIIFLPVLFTLTQGVQHITMYVTFGIMALFIACSGLHCIVFKITVNGRSIHVRKGVFSEFILDVSDIDRLDWIVASTGYGHLEDITVRAGSLKFSVATLGSTTDNPGTFEGTKSKYTTIMSATSPLMDHVEEMTAYLKANVDEDKIRWKIRKQR